MIKRLAAGLVVVGLALGIWALWPEQGSDPAPTTLPEATATTTTLVSTTTTLPSTTTTDESHVVTTVDEAEAILRELWFGWFEGIYLQDEERIKQVVGNPDQVEAAKEQFGVMEFTEPPTRDGIGLSDVEILRSDEECLAVWAEVKFSNFTTASVEGVHVFRPSGQSLLFVALWSYREDLWQQECESEL